MTASKKKEINQAQQTRFLRKIQFFTDFDENELKQFLAVSKWLKVPAGTLIIKEGATEMVFYILVKGQVSIYKTLAGGETLELTTLETGACFGEMALVSECKRSAGVMTTVDSYLLMVDPKIVSTSSVFLQLKFYKRFCEILVTRLDQTNRRVASQKGEKPPHSPSPSETAALPEKHPSAALVFTPEAEDFPEEKQPLPLPTMPDMKGRISPATLKPRLQSEDCLAVNPLMASRLASIISKKDGGDLSRQLTELILLDPVLSAKVLQVANSPFYRRTCPVLSVPHAMVIVGAQPLQKMVAETMEASRERRPFSGHSPLIRLFWQHALVVGRIAELLKDLIRIEVSVDIYLAGLLHDLGMLALDLREPRFYPQLLRPEAELSLHLEKSESDYIGTNHSTAGRWLGEFLGLPQSYLEVIRLHHQPEKASGEIAVPVALIHLADLLAAERGFCLGGSVPAGNLMESFAWVLIREQHRPFLDVNISDFLTSFNEELDKNWRDITGSAGDNFLN